MKYFYVVYYKGEIYEFDSAYDIAILLDFTLKNNIIYYKNSIVANYSKEYTPRECLIDFINKNKSKVQIYTDSKIYKCIY